MTAASLLSVDIIREAGRWPQKLPPIKKVALKTLETAGFFKKHKNTKADISIVLANDRFIRNLNAAYRSKDKATNVLSFPQEGKALDGSIALGDVVLAYETIRAEATAQGKRFNDHLMHLIIHGILHLMGHDHENERDARVMEKLEIRILDDFGVNNPYEI